jgi:chorismate mutase
VASVFVGFIAFFTTALLRVRNADSPRQRIEREKAVLAELRRANELAEAANEIAASGQGAIKR